MQKKITLLSFKEAVVRQCQKRSQEKKSKIKLMYTYRERGKDKQIQSLFIWILKEVIK